jgi:hypothetical protein
VQLLVHRDGDRVGEPRQALQVLERGSADARHPAELLAEPLLRVGPEAGDVVEDARRHALVPQLAVVADGEAVGLVPDALQQVQGLGLPWDPHRLGAAGDVDLLEPLGERGDGDLVVQAELLEDLDGHPELALPAVDEQELRRVAELAPLGDRLLLVGEVGAEAAGEDLAHGGEVVVARDVAHLEAAVLALGREGVLEHHHRAHVVGPLDVAHVVALDAQRGLGQLEVVLELVEGPGPAVVVGRPPQAVAVQLLPGVADHGLLERPLVPPLRHLEPDLRAPQLASHDS